MHFCILFPYLNLSRLNEPGFVLLSTDYMVKYRTFIFGSVMHLYWGFTQGRNYEAVDNILRIIKIFTFYTLAHNSHTHAEITHAHAHAHTQSISTLLVEKFIWKMANELRKLKFSCVVLLSLHAMDWEVPYLLETTLPELKS